jgi:hypothetical protein
VSSQSAQIDALERAQRKLMEINAADGLGHDCNEFMSDEGCEPCWRMACEVTQAFRGATPCERCKGMGMVGPEGDACPECGGAGEFDPEGE